SFELSTPSRHLNSFPTRRSSDLYCQIRKSKHLQSVSWCRLRDSNPRPRDYKSRALPAELSRLGNKLPRRSAPRTLRDPCSGSARSEEHTSELQSRFDLVCRLLLE